MTCCTHCSQLIGLAFSLLRNKSTFAENVLTPARLNESKHDYDGEEVTVRGWMRSGFENYVLWENREASSKGDSRRSASAF